MGFLSNLFGGGKKTLYTTHLDDEKILDKVFDLCEALRVLVKDLDRILQGTSVIRKDARLADMENKIILMKTKIDRILEHVSWIVDREVEKKDYMTIQDEEYLEDKYGRLESVSRNLEELAELVNARPSFSELKIDLMDRIRVLLNAVIDDLNVITEDDEVLEKIYSNVPDV